MAVIPRSSYKLSETINANKNCNIQYTLSLFLHFYGLVTAWY